VAIAQKQQENRPLSVASDSRVAIGDYDCDREIQFCMRQEKVAPLRVREERVKQRRVAAAPPVKGFTRRPRPAAAR
jgi:hypothetical protein